MPARNIKIIKPKIWVPPQFSSNYAFTVTRSDGTVDDLTNKAHKIEIEDGVTDTIGKFEFEIYDPNQTYQNLWTAGNLVKYYSDRASTATSLRFTGKIEKISHLDFKLKITGRSLALDLMEITVTKSYADTETSAIIKDLLDSYGTQFTYTNVNTSSTNATVNWTQKPFWECIQELCSASGFDFYIDHSYDAHYFESGTRLNTEEAIVHGYNLVEIGDFADDIALIKNRIIVYGANVDGIQEIYTAEDTTSQTKYGVKEEIINDSNITSYTQAQELGDYLLSKKKNPQTVAEIKGILLASIQPGEKLRLSAPNSGIAPSDYIMNSYKHSIGTNGLMTSVRIAKEPRKISHIIADMLSLTYQNQDASLNPYEMKYSYNFYFNSNSGVHNQTEIIDGVLKPTASSGNWTSDARNTSSDISQVYIVVVGETLTGATYEVSGNDGVNWQSISNQQLVTLITAKGSNLKVRVTFSNADCQIDSLSLMYKLS